MDILTRIIEETEEIDEIGKTGETEARETKVAKVIGVNEERVLDEEITGIYVCDLLSWVMSHANKGDAWITVQTHLNTIAVAVLLEIPCIIVPEGIKVEEATIKKAIEEDITILGSKMSAYEICWRAHEILC